MVYHDHSFIFPLLILRMEKFVVFANCSVKSAVEIRVSSKMPALQTRSGVAAGMLIQDCIYFPTLLNLNFLSCTGNYNQFIPSSLLLYQHGVVSMHGNNINSFML
jgi:hypothetical protein